MALNLPSLDASVHQARPNAKPEKRKTSKGRKYRSETKQKQSVRAQCVVRDGDCAVIAITGARWLDAVEPSLVLECRGESEWTHMHSRRRAQTRGQAPEARHDTAHSLMLCTLHHQSYDAHKLKITALTRKGADGPLKFRKAAQ